MDRQALKSALAPTPDCLTPEQLEALLGGTRPANAHLASCARCQAEMAMLKAFLSDEPVPGEGAAVAWIGSQLDRRMPQVLGNARVRPGREGWWGRLWTAANLRILVPAAAVVAVAITSFVVFRPSREPELRADNSSPVAYRSQQVDLLAPAGIVSAAPKSFSWKPFPAAARYRVVLMEVDKNELWQVETASTEASIPDAVRAKILPGKTVLWQVTALDAQGKVLATSQAERLVVSLERSEAGH